MTTKKKQKTNSNAAAGPSPLKTLALTAIYDVVRCVFDRTKMYEVRTQKCVKQKIGRLPVAGDKVCLLAGRYVVWCVVGGVKDEKMLEDLVDEHSYQKCVPWANTLRDALSLYRTLVSDDGSGYVRMLLNPPFKTLNF